MAAEKKFTFANVPSSEQIVFVCKGDQTRCKVHEHALLQRCPTMRSNIEAIRDRNPGKDIEFTFYGYKSEFEGLFQYIYTGTYDSPEPIVVTPKTDSNHASCSPQPIAKCNTSDQGESPEASEYEKSCDRCHDILWKNFQAECSSLKEKLPTVEHYSRPNTKPCESYENVFKWHVKMFLMSKYRSHSLGVLAKYKLYQSLISFQLYDERVVDIIRLLEFCYSQYTQFYEIGEIFSHYAAIHVLKFWRREDFVRLTRCNGMFARDLIHVLIYHRLPRRLSNQ